MKKVKGTVKKDEAKAESKLKVQPKAKGKMAKKGCKY